MVKNNFVELLKELKTTNSNKDKEAILAKYATDEVVKEMLSYNLNSYIMFYIKKLPAYDASKYIPDPTWTAKDRYSCFVALLKDLAGRHTTGNLAKTTVEGVFRMFTQDEYEAYGKVLLKKPIGVGVSTVNKVFTGLIPVFDVMKAPTELAKVSSITYPRYGQIKYDGFRAVYIPYEDDLIFGASGLPIRNKRIIAYFEALQNVGDQVIDGEIYSHEHSFEEISSVLNSEDKEVPKSFKFIAFDMVSVVDWKAKSSKTVYADRLTKLRTYVQSIIGDRKKIQDVPTEIFTSSGEAVEFYKKCLKDGYEGSMLWNPMGYYQWKRVTHNSGEILKMKPVDSVDVAIEGFYEGEGESNKGTLGGITFTLSNGVTCNCGSGFSHDLGKEIWGNQSKFLGKMVEIEFFEYTEEGSLRHPRFKRFRPDKDK